MKKFKKLIYVFLLMILIVPCAFMFCGCTTTVSVTSIEKTDTHGYTDVYTVTYSDGSTSTFEVTNGKDGADVTIDDVYNKYVQTYGDISYADFVAMYLNLSIDYSHEICDCLLSTVKVYSQFTEVSTGLLGGSTTGINVYTGGGIIYRQDATYTYIITNYHIAYSKNAAPSNTPNCIEGLYEPSYKIANKFTIYLYGSEDAPYLEEETNEVIYGNYAIDAKYVGGSITADIAVLRAQTADINAINPNFKPVKVANGYHVGETAIAVGNPQNKALSVTQGIISVDNEYINVAIDTETRSYRSIRVDTALYSGNSGGGLFNNKGELIGITNAGNGSTEQNINYAIPYTIAINVASNIIYYATDGQIGTNGAYKPVLGITVTAQNTKYELDTKTGVGKIVEDIAITDLTSGSLAEQLGLKLGDLIKTVTIGDQTFELLRNFDIGDILYNIRPGSSITFKVSRDGQDVTLNAQEIAFSQLVSVA